MKRTITRFFAAALYLAGLCFSMQAKDYKVLYLSSPDAVSIDGQALKVGDFFSANTSLVWKDERQVLKAADVETKKQIIICAKQMEGNHRFSLDDYSKISKPLASRGGAYNTLQELSTLFQGEVIVDGHWVIPAAIRQDETHFFYLTCKYPDETVNKAIPPVEGYLLLCVDAIYKIDGNPIVPLLTEASLYYYDAEKQESTCVSSGFFIVPVPE